MDTPHSYMTNVQVMIIKSPIIEIQSSKVQFIYNNNNYYYFWVGMGLIEKLFPKL